MRLAFSLAALPLASAACEMGANLAVCQESGTVTITATLVGSHDPACLTNVDVYADGELSESIWNLVAPLDAPCRTTVTLGRVPPGFSPDDGAPGLHLLAGHIYVVNAHGAGWTAAARFTDAR